MIDLLKHIWIPIVVIGTAGTAGLIRIMRANLLDELNKPYVVTAQAKGVPRWRALFKYPFRVAINPLLSTIGWLLPAVISGDIIVSVVLSLQTTGPLYFRALLNQDMFLAGSILMFLAVLTVIGTLISDLLLAWVEASDSVSYSINLSHGGLRFNGKLCRHEQELEDWREAHPQDKDIGIVKV